MQPELARYAEVFRMFDDNDDGLLNAKELAAALERLGRPGQSSGAEQMRSYDADGSGSIGFDEFVALLAEAPTDQAD